MSQRPYLTFLFALSVTLLFAAPVSEPEAISAAQTWWRHQEPERAGLCVQNIQAIERDKLTLLYILNSEDGGFVLISADTDCPPILAYSGTGSFSYPATSPAVDAWLEEYSEQITAIKQEKISQPANQAQWSALLSREDLPLRPTREIPPLLTSTWDQGYPYNADCPVDASSIAAGGHAWAGCGAAAIAQVMGYWGYPEHGSGSRSYQSSLYGTIYANFAAATYDWDNMPTTCSPDNTAIPYLLYHCAVALTTYFGPDVSTFTTWNLASALNQFFSYNYPNLRNRVSYSDQVWKSMIVSDLDLYRPVIYIAAHSAISHLFILDGYQNQDYFHVNWCWNGQYDGYYYLDNLNPGGVLYSGGHAAVFDIYPELDIPIHPLNLTATLVSNYRIDLNWMDLANNEQGYIIQRKSGSEGLWTQIATMPSNSCSYQDLELESHTTYHYRAKAYNANGSSSLSNEVYAITAGIIAPVVATIAPLETGQALLIWAPSANAVQYRIYHCDLPKQPGAEGWTLLGETASTSWPLDGCYPRRFYYVSALTGLEMPQSFVEVTGGTFHNGTSDVTVSTFFIDKYELSQDSYLYVMGNNPSNFTGDPNRPVEKVSWFKAIEYCNRRSLLEGIPPCYSYGSYGTNPDDWPAGWNTSDANHQQFSCNWSAGGYRLPSEMEWMYAAWSGNLSYGYIYSGSNTVEDVAWYRSNAGNTTHPVGQKYPNELGLYDMSGNAYEWVWDIYGGYPSVAQTNPHGAISGPNRVRRGGGFSSQETDCMVTKRGYTVPTRGLNYSGFRVCRIVP